MSQTPRKNEYRIICLPFEQKTYFDIVQDDGKFRVLVDSFIEQSPELFPAEIHKGYQLKDIRHPRKLPVPIRRVRLKATKISYTVRPSFVMPYLTAMTEEAKKVLYLRKSNVLAKPPKLPSYSYTQVKNCQM